MKTHKIPGTKNKVADLLKSPVLRWLAFILLTFSWCVHIAAQKLQTYDEEETTINGRAYGTPIVLKLSSGVVNSYTDKINGSYTYVITGVPQGPDPDVTITILGKILYTGKLSKVNEVGAARSEIRQGWWFWLVLAAVPLIAFFAIWNITEKWLVRSFVAPGS